MTKKTYNKEEIKIAVKLQRSLDNALTAFLPNYFGDDRITTLDDCFQYLMGECDADKRKEIEENLLNGEPKHAEEVYENRQSARKIIGDILKATFSEIVDSVVEAETYDGSEDAWREVNNEEVPEQPHTEFFESTPLYIEMGMNDSPFKFVKDIYNWSSIADLYMESELYQKLDAIYMHFVEKNGNVEVLNEKGGPMTDDEMRHFYNKEMGAFIKKAIHELDIAIQDGEFNFLTV